jgi:hypothetical protein
MSIHDTDETVLDAVKGSLDGVTMYTPVERIETAGRARLRRRQFVRAATGLAAVTGLALGVPALSHPSTAPPAGAGQAHIRMAAFTLAAAADGTIEVTWDKGSYFSDHAGLEQALHQAGFPVLIKEGEFCKGPDDDGTLDPSGVGPGVSSVMQAKEADRSQAKKNDADKVVFIFKPAAMPAGKQLFIGFLSPAQLEATGGSPGSVERLVPTGVELTCTTEPPPPNTRVGSEPDRGGTK